MKETYNTFFNIREKDVKKEVKKIIKQTSKHKAREIYGKNKPTLVLK